MLTPYEQGYQDQLEKLGFSFNPIKGLKNMFGGAKPAVTPTAQATQLPFAKTRVSLNPGQPSPSSGMGLPRLAEPGKRTPGLLAEGKQLHKEQRIYNKSDAAMQGFYARHNPAMVGKRTNWNLDAAEATIPYPGDAAHIQNLQETDRLNKGIEAIKVKKAPQAGEVALNTRMVRQGNQLGREAGNEMPTAMKVGSSNQKEERFAASFYAGLYSSVG
jgi:hypothetical protein